MEPRPDVYERFRSARRSEPTPDVIKTLTVSETAKALHLSRTYTYALIRSGELPAVQITPRRVVVTVADLNDYIERHKTSSMNKELGNA